ncbi:zinc metalloproteinase nas-13-like [Diorhabda carinulata]|uniref:zinc metalloproteinase nas-13-like n=1 Tax=Diorhabda carinulata TaxID=1163345 RepID=UPI0025A14B99|nr:zinc metalloproteinase nas-13-like [Diorhabda carinulata]
MIDLSSWDESHPQNPEEFGEYFEGDINEPNIGRNGIVGEEFRWEKGQIPYEISGLFSTNDRKMIAKAMELYQKYTCISFRPRNESDDDYILITNQQTGCWSSVGKKGGVQEVNLQSPQCTTKIGTPIHELMHAIGFLHEQNRHERDDFVTIHWNNIKKGKESNFNKAKEGYAVDYGIPYDFISVMHYSSTAFSYNGQRTISPKEMYNIEKMGQRNGFSKGDITKINAMYNCPEKTQQLNITGETTNETIEGNTSSVLEERNPFWQAANSLFSIFVK